MQKTKQSLAYICMLAPHKHVRTCTHANTLAHTDLFNLSHVLFFFATGDGKDESLKFTNPEDEVNWEEEQKVCNYKQLTYYVHFNEQLCAIFVQFM